MRAEISCFIHCFVCTEPASLHSEFWTLFSSYHPLNFQRKSVPWHESDSLLGLLSECLTETPLVSVGGWGNSCVFFLFSLHIHRWKLGSDLWLDSVLCEGCLRIVLKSKARHFKYSFIHWPCWDLRQEWNLKTHFSYLFFPLVSPPPHLLSLISAPGKERIGTSQF